MTILNLNQQRSPKSPSVKERSENKPLEKEANKNKSFLMNETIDSSSISFDKSKTKSSNGNHNGEEKEEATTPVPIDFVGRSQNGFATSSNSYDKNVGRKGSKYSSKNLKRTKEKSTLNGGQGNGSTIVSVEDEASKVSMESMESKLKGISIYKSRRGTKKVSTDRRPSEVVRSLENKVCEGSLMYYDIVSKSWTKIYVVLTKVFIYFYHLKREYEISRMGYKTGKSKVTIGDLLRDPIQIIDSNLYLCHLPKSFLQRDCTFKISSSCFSIFLSTSLSKKKNRLTNEGQRSISDTNFSNVIEMTLLKRWSKAVQSVGAKIDLAMYPKGLYPQPIEDDIYSCIHCGCNVHRYRRHLVEEKDTIRQKGKENAEKDLEVLQERERQKEKNISEEEEEDDDDDDSFYFINRKTEGEENKKSVEQNENENKNDNDNDNANDDNNSRTNLLDDEGFLFNGSDKEETKRRNKERISENDLNAELMENPFYREDLIAFYPKPASNDFVSEIPCAFLKTSSLQCERCQILSESLRLKRINMNYNRYNLMLEEGKEVNVSDDGNTIEKKAWNYSSYKKHSTLKRYFDEEDINTKEWPLELPPAIPLSEADFAHGRKQENGYLLLRRGNPPDIPVNEYKVKGLFAPPRVAGKGKRKIFG